MIKYIAILFLFLACTPKYKSTENGKLILGKDSTAVTVIPLRIVPTIDSSFTGLSFIQISVSTDSGRLSWHLDGRIVITGDTMRVIRQMLEGMKQNSERQTKLYKENEELRQLILNNETSTYHYTVRRLQ